MHVVVAPDKFKGSLTAPEVCQAIERGLRRYDADLQVTTLPLADGGEGSLDLLISLLGLEVVRQTVNDPLFRPVAAYYGKKGTTAYVELAKASGLVLLTAEERSALSTSTYGTGELIRHAIEHGAREVYLLIGGSASNDAGIGIAQALGYQFLDASGNALPPTGASLAQVATIRFGTSAEYLKNTTVRVISDVNNPLYGPQGAAYVYGPQKGASSEDVTLLDEGLRRIASKMSEFAGQPIEALPGAGAAGGVGAGAVTFLRAQLLPGAATLMDLCGAPAAIQRSDLVISGEGKVDQQTLHGKVIRGVSDACRAFNVPLGVVCGSLEADEIVLQQLGVWRAYAVKENTMSLAEAILRAPERTETLAHQLLEDFVREKGKR